MHGYSQQLLAARLAVDEEEGGYDAALRLLSSDSRPTALFASIDDQAIGVMRSAAT
ncbi:hypothetical protein [Nonomuraea sp. NPDC049784]|uniref:hypothetical protein n=1 Tax=Nonomuraea sp. NPDC049784 TaxID=3154361 RepID=UPI0033E7F47F